MAINLNGNAESTYSSDISAADGTFSGNARVEGEFRSGATNTNVAVIGTSGIIASYRQDSTSKACFQTFVATSPGSPTGEWFSDGSLQIGGTLPANPNITLNANGGIEAFPNSADRGTNLRVITSGVDNQTQLRLNGNGSANYSAIGLGGNSTNKFLVRGDGQISSTSTTIAALASERRLKENIFPVDASKAWETIKTVPYYSYNFIGTDADQVRYGPIVDEVPDEMRVATDATDEVGVIHTYDNGMLQARLYTALQTALTRIEALEAEVQALKGGNS